MTCCCCERHEALGLVYAVDGGAGVARGVVRGALQDHVTKRSTPSLLAEMRGLCLLFLPPPAGVWLLLYNSRVGPRV